MEPLSKDMGTNQTLNLNAWGEEKTSQMLPPAKQALEEPNLQPLNPSLSNKK
jgi:hypothetical protein